MRPETIASLADVLLASERVNVALEDVSLDQFLGNWEKQAVIERMLITIGEALSRIRSKEPGALDQIPDSAKVIGLRNLLVHGYDAVDAATLYRVARESLPNLAETVRPMLLNRG